MIHSKPQTGTLLSFTIFLLITMVALLMNAWVVVRDPNPAWYSYLVMTLLIPIALFVTYKIFIRYKTVKFGNNQVEISYPVLRQTKKYPLEMILSWRESVVKTGKASSYKELEIRFTDKFKVTMGHREVSEYPRIIQYLNQKVGKKKLAG